MDTTKLVAALDQMIAQDRPPDEKIFLRFLKEIWQIDPTVAPYDVWDHMIEWDAPYFSRFMGMDEGDEAEEEGLIRDWIRSRMALRVKSSAPDWQRRMIALIAQANRIRATAGQ